MRRRILLFLLVTSLPIFSQSITVNTSTYTVPQLVSDILVNSPCASARNVSWRTGTDFGSTNGIGYFQNTNPAFPFANGVVLTTGDVTRSPGPNTADLSDGSPAWTGDAALETALLASGITINSVNATVLEFDFTSFTTYFNFQFLFASEEYGTFQCQSPDAFAFLLTDSVTGITTNLAVIPTTTIPISVETIRNNLYNSSCPSANPGYFGSFNGGAAAGSSSTNYNGQTIAMNANASLVPNRSYHIKLVIADNNLGGTSYDSAIFIGGSSFVFAQDILGPDVTLCNNDGTNENYTITSGLDPAVYSFVWKDAAGNPIPGETGPNFTTNVAGTYQLTYYIQASNCEVGTNDITLSYEAAISTPDPVNLYNCDSGSANYTYNLSYNTPIVDPSNQYQISYHNTQPDAQSGVNALPLSYNELAGNLPKTIWTRIVNPTTGCYFTKSFLLDLTTAPVATNPGVLTECETVFGSGIAAFNLQPMTPIILGGQSPLIYNITYHNNATDASLGINPIDITNPIITGNTTIYVRIETNTDPNCFNVINFNLVVKPRPIVDTLPSQYVCLEYILPVLTNPGTYYSGPNQGLPMLTPGTVITTNQTIYIYSETGGSPNCSSESSFDVFVIGLLDVTPGDIISCDSATVPAYQYPGTQFFTDPARTIPITPGTVITTLGTTTIYLTFTYSDVTCPTVANDFDITIHQTPTISNTFSNIFDCNQINSLPTINTNVGTANYYTYDIATDIYTPLAFPITTTTAVFAFAENNGCRSTIYPFTVYIGSLGLANVDLCIAPYALPPAPIGEYRDAPNGGGNIIPAGNISTNTRVYAYIPGYACTNDDFFDITFHQPSLTVPTLSPQCDSYILPANPEGGRYFTQAGGTTNAANTEYLPGHVITATETIYIYKESTLTLIPVCYNEVQWTITINPRPIIDSRGPQVVCYSYALTSLINGGYFEDANGVNPITDFTIDASDLRPGIEQTTRVKTIYIYAANPNDPTCFSENSFTITLDGIEADDLGPNQTHCDTYTLPALSANNFYYDASHLSGGGNMIAPGTVYTTSTITPIFIYTESFNRFSCKDETSFNIVINDTPVLTPAVQNSIVECNTYTLQPLTIGNYYTLPGGPTVVGNALIIVPVTYDINNLPPAVIYAYAETATTPNCSVEEAITITLQNVTELPDVPATCNNYQLDPNNLQAGENYYSSPNGVGLLASNATITTTQTIYIYRNYGTCSDESDFVVTIIPEPVANPAVIPAVCDTYNNEFDGISLFDLTQVQAQVLGAQTPATDFIFEYFTSFADANNPTATPIANPTAYENDDPFTDSIWARISNITSTNACFDVTQVNLTINPSPRPILLPEYAICQDYETGTLLNSVLLDTGLSGPNYSFAWTLNGIAIGDITPSITVNTIDTIGLYTVTVTDLTTTCDITISTTVVLYSPHIEIVYSDAFASPSFITINVLGAGSGNYEYQLDGGLFQDSNIFYDVTPGEHEVAVRDKDGKCAPAPQNAIIINYPKFFTPNGDNYHETWNIWNLEATNPNAPIYIFDRFGKFLKQITPSSKGWDGTFNGQPLPSTDYWFTVDYIEKGSTKTFKAHFALKR